MSKQEPIPPTDEELEAMWQQIIANAIEAGTVVPAERLFGGQMYNIYANNLAVTSDRIKAFAILDEVLQKELGYHHGFDWAKYFKGAEHDQCHIVYKNTTDTGLLVGMIHDKIKYILEKKQDRGAHSMQFLSDWKESKTPKPTPSDNLSLLAELATPRAITAIDNAIKRGWIERAPEGLKWRGIGTGKPNTTQLAYFCQQAWLPNNKERLPETAINNLFGVNRIGKYVTQLMDTKQPQKWRALIDELFVD